MCSGKVYYDLYEEREKRGIDDVYLLRVEQLYPVPLKALVQELGRFSTADFVWCQEEPRTWAPGLSSIPISNGCCARSARRASGRLCRTAGLCRHRHRPDIAAPQATAIAAE